jgi:hypothetical protein
VGLRGGFRVEHNLGYALAVSQIDEDQGAVVSSPMHPPGERDFFADVLRSQISAVDGLQQSRESSDAVDRDTHGFAVHKSGYMIEGMAGVAQRDRWK